VNQKKIRQLKKLAKRENKDAKKLREEYLASGQKAYGGMRRIVDKLKELGIK